MPAFLPVLSLFGLVAAGWIVRRTGLIREDGIEALTRLVLYVGIPCISVAKMQQDASPQLTRDLTVVFFLGIALMFAGGGVGWLLFRRAPEEQRAVLVHLSFFSNCGFMGYPVVIALLGEAYLIYAVVFNAAFNLLTWTIGVVLLNRRAGVRLGKALLTPALVGAVLGLALFLTGLRLPSVLQEPIETLGGLTTPLSMLVIGSRMYGQNPRGFLDPRIWLVSALRLLIFPLLTFGLCLLLGTTPQVRTLLTLVLGMPCAAVTAMHAEHYGGDRVLASSAVALSTVMSLLTIPILVLLF